MDTRPGRRGRSRSGGVPVALADGPGAPATLFGDVAPAAARRAVLPGAVVVPQWLDDEAQRDLATAFREWARPPAGLRHPRMPTGHLMTVQSVCLGWHWQPYAYSQFADDPDGTPVKPLPAGLVAMARGAVADTFGTETAMRFEPDAAIVNLY